MSKLTARELIDRAYERETGVVLATRVEKVLALHKMAPLHADRGFGRGPCCIHCSRPGCAPWPCLTVRLLEGEEDR